jgi:FkbM family methyltransferase
VAPWAPTGYGQQTAIFTPRIRDLGHDVALSVYYGHQGCETSWKGMRVLPPYSANYGTDVLVPHALHHFKADDCRSMAEASCRGMVITLGDVWTFEAPLLNQLAIAAWVPIDHLTLPEVVRNWFEVMGAIPIAMSRHGERLLGEAGVPCVYVPHGIDIRTFSPGDQTAARTSVGLPADAFVVGMVANNVGRDGNRKAFAEQITAFAELRRKHSDAMLVLHTDVDQPAGVRLRPFLERMLPKDSYTYTDQYTYRKGMPAARVVEIYQAMDVLSNCSYGEGFGIPIVEAQACGTPVIVTDSTSMPELCGSGWKVGYETIWHDSQSAWASVPHIADIADAYELAYDKARDEGMHADAWAFAQDYDADLVTERYWKPALERLEKALESRRSDLARVATSPPVPRVREADGLLWVDKGPGSGTDLGWGEHEKELRPILDDLLPEGGVLLDVGAHVGHWSLRLAAKASRVYAVEANPDTASVLRRNLAINDIRNVEVIELAAWDEWSSLRLFDPADQMAGGSTRVLAANNGDGTVHAHRLDVVLHYLDRLDLVKLDVEGADIRALNGMAGLLAKFRPTLFVECHDIYGYYKRADLEAALTELGYTWRVAHSYATTWMPEGFSPEPQIADYLVATPVTVDA